MEGDAGTSRLNPTVSNEPVGAEAQDTVGATQTPELTPAESPKELDEQEVERQDGASPGRLGRGWFAAIGIGLLVLAGGIGYGGHYVKQAHDRSAQIARDDAVALQAAKDCVTATQAPDPSSAGASQAEIIECSTGDFGAQAGFYSGMIVEAYQAANVKVEVSDLRAAVERHNDDGSVLVLVAVKTKVSNSQAAEQVQGYRLRVLMQRDNGTYKIAKLDQVTS